MKNINTTKKSLLTLLIVPFALILVFAQLAYAAPQDNQTECEAAGGQWGVVSPEVNPPEYGCLGLQNQEFTGFTPPNNEVTGAHDCNGVPISIDVECVSSENPILGYLAAIINFLAAGVGIVVTGAIIVGGIQYITAGGVPQKLESARKKIINALIALLTFIFLYAILNWLIPGGLITGGSGPGGDDTCEPGQSGPC